MSFYGSLTIGFISVQFSHSVMSDSLRPHGLQHARPPCPSPTPRVYSNSCPLSWWCHPTISSLPAFNLSQHQGLFEWASSLPQVAKVLEFQLQHQSFQWNVQDWLPLELTGLIPLHCKGLSKSLLQHHSPKVSILQCSAFFIVQISHTHMTTGKTTALTSWTFVDKVMSLLFNMLSRLVITFLPRSNRLLISWFWRPDK